MRDYQPVTIGAEHGKTPVLFLDATAPYAALTEAAFLRLDSARCLVDALEGAALEEHLASTVARAIGAVRVLIDEASALFAAADNRLTSQGVNHV